MYTVVKSVAGTGNITIASAETFAEARKLAKRAGATGKLEPRGRGEWCFCGGRETVGFWIIES